MSRKIRVIILFLLFLITLSINFVFFYIQKEENKSTNIYIQKLLEEERVIFENKEYKEKEMKYILELGENIPNEYLEYFYNEGWHFRFTDEMKDEAGFEYPYGTLIGLTLINKKEIQILNYPEGNVTRDTLYHEFAHYIDLKNDDISQSEEFNELYSKNVDTYKSREYVKINSKEWFAELIVDYYLYNEKMENFNDLENFIANILEEDL